MKHYHQMLVRSFAILGIGFGALGCGSSATEPAVDGLVHARGVAHQVAVTNATNESIFVAVHGRQASSRINWAACVGGPACEPLGAGATRLEIPFTIEGLAETEAIVNWWYAVRGDDGIVRPDSIRTFVVRL